MAKQREGITLLKRRLFNRITEDDSKYSFRRYMLIDPIGMSAVIAPVP